MECSDPQNFYLEDLTASSAKISWVAANAVTQYSLVISPTEITDFTNPDSYNAYTVNVAEAEYTGLDAGTTYYLYVKSLCDAATGYEQFAFTTLNAPFALPYFEPFTDCTVNQVPSGWSVLSGDVYTSNSVYNVSDGQDVTLYMVANTLVVLPNISVANISELEISIDAVSSKDNAQLTVGLVSNVTDDLTFEPLATFDVSKYSIMFFAISDYINYRFDTYTGDAKHIALRASADIYIDDVTVDNLSSCIPPSNLQTTLVKTYTATASWSNTGANGSRVVLSKSNAYDIASITATNIVLDTLLVNGEQELTFDTEESTTYYLFVASNCDDVTTNAAKVQFTTKNRSVDLPFYEPISVTSMAEFSETGWSNLVGIYEFNTLEIEGDTILGIAHANNTIPYLQLPTLADEYNVADLVVDFEVVSRDQNSSYPIYVGVLETSGDVSTFSPISMVYYPTLPTTGTVLTPFRVSLESYTGSSKHLCISSTYFANFWIDDIRVSERSACLAPSGLSISNIQAESAVLSFSPIGDQTEWRVVVTSQECNTAELDAMTPESAQFMQDVTTTSYITLTNLQAETGYYVYVRGVGNCDDTPAWSYPTTFTTIRGKMTLPYYEPLAITNKSQLLNLGLTTVAGDYSINTYSISGDTILEIYNNPYLLFAELDERYNVRNLGLNFEAMPYSTGETPSVVIGVMELPGIPSSFVPLDTIVLSERPTPAALEQCSTIFENYTGSSRYICMIVPNSGDLYIDDLYVYEITPCMAPDELTISDITGATANLSFHPVLEQNKWRVVVVDRECTAEELNAMTAEDVAFMQDVTKYADININNLEGRTEYYVYVRGIGNCDDTPQWSEYATFTTLFAPLSLPYFEDFTTTDSNFLPDGWTRSNTNAESQLLEFMDASYYRYKEFATYEVANIESSPLLYTAMNGDATTAVYRWAVGPEVIIDQSGLLGFDLTLTPGSKFTNPLSSYDIPSESEIRVYISTDFGNTWNKELVIGNNESDDYQMIDFFETTGRVIFDIYSYIGDTIKFAFYIDNVDAINIDVNIDNININCVEEKSYSDVISEGYDYQRNGFDIFYTKLTAGETMPFELYVPASDKSMCDSVISLSLTVLENAVTNITGEICAEGDVYDANGFTESYAGLYVNYDVAASGADSLTYLTLTYRESNPITSLNGFICEGGEYLFAGAALTESGVYRDTLVDSFGCDSIIELTLTAMADGEVEYLDATICDGGYYGLGGTQYTAEGVYTVEMLTDAGCEYTVELTLSVLNVDTTYAEKTITLDDLPYEYRDAVFGEDTEVGVGTYEFAIDNGTDCPDIEILTLTVIEGDVAVDNTRILDLTIYPNPLAAGATLYVDAEFTAAERDGMVVEAMNMVGQRIVSAQPTTDKITINGLTQSGLYIVRITTGTGVQYIGKVIVK
ncbi:MAG: fibronectin type III domain-containing protein [bacterium]